MACPEKQYKELLIKKNNIFMKKKVNFFRRFKRSVTFDTRGRR